MISSRKPVLHVLFLQLDDGKQEPEQERPVAKEVEAFNLHELEAEPAPPSLQCSQMSMLFHL